MGRSANRTKVCASVAAPSPAAMVRKAERALSLGSDLVEFRLDTLEEPSSQEVERVVKRFADMAVVTVRSKADGGKFVGGEGERLDLISRLTKIGPAYVDVELSTATKNGRWLDSLPRSVQRIVSWHDFRTTPRLEALRKIRDIELEHGLVAKVVTMATKLEDNAKTVALCRENPGRVVSFCMGELGSISRVMAMALGSPIAYAALPKDAVAPGQLSIPAMTEFRRLVSQE